MQLRLKFGIDAFDEGKTLSETDNNALMVLFFSIEMTHLFYYPYECTYCFCSDGGV